jgi:HAMP domain-containing protein
MRFTIATKLFIGFLCVIGLNTAYLVVVAKISNVNGIVDIVKRKNEVKNKLLRLKTLHRVQGPSIISYANIGRQESIDNFRNVNLNIVRLIDTILRQMDTIAAIDSRLSANKPYERDLSAATQGGSLIRTIAVHSNRYSALFEKLVDVNASASQHQKASGEKAILDSLETVEWSLTAGLDSAESIVSEEIDMRIRDIGRNVAEVKDATVLILCGITLFSLVFGLIFSRTITNALRRLKESAARIGQADFDIKPPKFPNDEIGDLAKAFSAMAVDLRNKQDELIRSKRLAAIGEIVASVNHEINNPLMIISGNAQFLEMSMEGSSDDMKERVRTIIEETERISEITRKLREIKNPVSQDYLAGGGQMIDIDRSR